ncbi:TetR/AcrR family transcriptional regulator [Actinomadura xylanilytica]|uniref:TetR/AcrR family transcriptional regulator n=1 Tax=Actinomadura xylanilytica TaxID=887459 RepID=UPI00255A9BDE|nr:TetR/AcrR family transcriptional regulator [Actinomadura xylanilytica]MDL4774629.1 TetR/AcrR family transcriptional regulator [Actinomadura xylanilytica]
MPKVVDPEERRQEIAEAVFRVARRDGLELASLRNVAEEAGLAIGSVRHYFAGQADIMNFAMNLFALRAGKRLLARAAGLRVPGPDAPPAAHVATLEAMFAEVLPIDAERREEAEVWLAFTTSARTRSELAPLALEMHDDLRRVIGRVLTGAAGVGVLRPGLDPDEEAGRTHALIDGMTLHAILQPDRLGPSGLAAMLRRHVCAITTVRAEELPPLPE